ncbi:PREDICTED: eukaryotic translation initiation factor 2D [Dufourea novaeangliae]|uniref:Eukaryotic translation initiation factor 2D n=1 Tax=Dufourea novaeangliae TaxID=178035 RepID=A0A154PLU8_DUFNO|nr:PREDICTED: eukaryotic translation initiation factor 2D [Dufourea novaeangliae]KZC12822.1 Eukaryotic translation initiation factor 2D [Dufourea novaeangliae]
MFIKPFKVKSNNQLKGTERKKLCQEILTAYPTLTDDEIQSLIPKKEAISAMKIATHSGQLGKVYCVAKVPMFFQLDFLHLLLLPTIYTLWYHPNLLKVFTTKLPVVSKLAGGADLMLPGVIVNEPVTLYTFGKLHKGTPVSVDTDDNKASVAVGITARSSEDMYMSGGHGKCIEILHVIGDTLCQLGKPPSRPNLGPANIGNDDDKLDNLEETSNQVNESYDNPPVDAMNDLEVSNENVPKTESPCEENVEEDEVEETEQIGAAVLDQQEAVIDPVQEMDNLLEYCFLKACKTSVKSGDLPMLVSNFFKNHLMAACPPDKNVDIKKSRYKKLSVFLAEMKAKGVINTSITKGVESILSIKFDHPSLRKLVILEEPTPAEPVVSNTAVVSECYKVTADVVPVLSKFGYEKGDVMKRAEIRKCFTEYVKRENLQDGKMLKLNPQLAGIMKTKADQVTVSMEDGINKFIGRMTHMHEVTLAGNKLLHTGKLEPIDMRVTVRSGGKKVTLVNNLETFGINSKEFSKECQNIGASATITDEPGKKTPSVLVQGNQILYVYKLLTEKYQIKKTYIRGLEFAPKKPGVHKK